MAESKFDVIMADPPWPKLKGGRRRVRPNQSRDLDYRSPNTLRGTRVLTENGVLSRGKERHTLFLWVVDQFLLPVEEWAESLGYRRHARLVWDKKNGVAPAYSLRYCHEYLLWLYKGKWTPVDKSSRGVFGTVFSEAAREHSRKPEIAYRMVEQWYPNARKLDAFSRQSRKGWVAWGDECGKFDT